MPIESKQKYVYKGIEYDTWAEAHAVEQADIDAASAAYDPTSDIDGLAKRFEVLMIGTRKQRENNPDGRFGWQTKMPMLLIVDSKHDTQHFLITTPQDLMKVSFSILSERLKEGHWYFDEQEILAKAIVDRNQSIAAFTFLQARAKNEYEDIEITEFNKVDEA